MTGSESGKNDRWSISPALKHAMSEVARELRRRSTRSEEMLWQAVRRKKLGVKFRRQQPIGNFVVDFYAPDVRLVVEVDGGIHGDQAKADFDRQALLESLGLRVLRLTAEQVETDLAGALEAIRQAFHPHP